MSGFNEKFGRPMTENEYSTEWEKNSVEFRKNLNYEWMADFIDKSATVLEVGCGPGFGTLALAKRGIRVFSIEINESLADKAFNHLTENSIRTSQTTIDNIDLANDCQVTIIKGDILDLALTERLMPAGINTVVCWLIGAQPAIISERVNVPLEKFTGQEMPDYRNIIHSRCYEIGAAIFSEPNCAVHIVDRMGLNSWQEKDNTRDNLRYAHEELSDPYSFEFKKENIFLKRVNSIGASTISNYSHSTIGYIPPTLVLSSVKSFYKMQG